MGAVRDHQGRVVLFARVDYDAMTAPKGIISIPRSPKMSDVLPSGVVLDNVILPIAVYHIKVTVSWIYGGFRGDELSGIFIFACFLGIIQLINFFSL